MTAQIAIPTADTPKSADVFAKPSRVGADAYVR